MRRGSERSQARRDRRWLILVVIGIAQLMVVLDVTIVNIALPSAQQDLGFSDDDRQWVVTAYALAFGSLLLLVGIVSTRVLPHTGPRPLVPAGMALAALGMVLLTRIGIDTAYASHVLPSLILIGAGVGLTMAPAFATATFGVPARDSGATSAMVNTSQQVGGAIGTALLSTLAVSAATDFMTDRGPGPELLHRAAVEGYIAAFWWAGGILALGALICGSLLRSGVRPELGHAPAQPAPSR